MSTGLDTTDTRVRRALPAIGGEWIAPAGHLSGLLRDLAEREHAGDTLPAPLGSRVALRAWGRLQGVIDPAQRQTVAAAAQTVYPALCFVTVAAADVAVFGAAARELGRSHSACGNQAVTLALARSATAVQRTPEQLIMQVARVHGVLDLDLGADGHILTEWGADGPVFVTPPPVALAAHRRIASRVYTMWQAGQDLTPAD